MPRALGRIIATAAIAVAAITMLTACDKPLPKVTVLSGSTTVVLEPQTYCFDASHCHQPGAKIAVVDAAAGSTLLVDVPREIADHAWSVSSGTFTKGLLKTFVGDNYSTGAIKNTHSARVEVPFGVGSYTLAIQTNQATWVAQVKVKR